VIATKFGLVPGDGSGRYVISGRPHYVRRACGASLKRLGTDHIDPYYQHRLDARLQKVPDLAQDRRGHQQRPSACRRRRRHA
jgi:aryl-alcohol dehydrogenase-like predicted oxidoreductase